MSAEIRAAALAWHAAGASVLPAIRGKRPSVDWKAHQEVQLDPALVDWDKFDGLGMVTGYGGFEMFELEGRAVQAGLVPKLVEAINEAMPGLVGKLMTYCERTPSGGIHWVYRVEGELTGSTQLAREPREGETPPFKVLIETRGKFAWTVLAPSAASVHEERLGEWSLISGAPGVVATLTEEEREILFDCARSLDQMPPPPPVEHRPAMTPANTSGELSPGQDFEARADWMADILGPLGWRVWKREGDKVKLTRPGKNFGTSATINYDGNDNLYVFSSSTDFPSQSSWTKFGAYAFLHHGGDYSAAARDLRGKGYGSQREPAARILRLVPGGAAGPPQAPSGPSTEGSSALQPERIQITTSLTDDGNGLLLVSRIKGSLLYSPDREMWLAWDGAKWSFESGRYSAIQAMRETIRAIQPRDDLETKHKIKSLGWKAIENAVKLAAADPVMHVKMEQLDADPWALNTPVGVVNLRTGELSAPTPEARHTRITGCAVDFARKPERFLAFLRQIFSRADDPERMIEFIQRLAGWTSVGQTGHQILPFLHGATGANGKTQLMEVFQLSLGSYAGTAPADLLLATSKEDYPAQAELSGRRMVVCSEMPRSAKFHEERAKRLTGGDRVAGRFLYANYFEFTPTHHLWLHGNHQPQVSAGGNSFWRRMRLIPFNYTVPPEEQVEGFAQLLFEEEGPAILAWMIEGARKQRDEHKLHEPAEVVAATSTYAEEEDALGRFVEEECVIGGGKMQRELIRSVWERYTRWCDRSGEKPLTSTMFGREMKGRFGLGDAKSSGHKLYTNISLRTPQADIEDDRPVQEPLS